jgi:MFS family permease
VTLLVYAHLGVWGYFLYGFGPVVPLLRDEQGVSASVASLHGTALAVGAVAAGALFPALTRRFGRATTLWSALVGIGVTVAVLSLARALPATLLATVAVATCGSLLINAVVATLTAYHGAAGPAAISEANAVACGMGVVAPAVVGLTVRAGLGWRPGIAVVVGLVGLLTVVALVARIRLPYGVPGAAADVSAPRRLPAPYWLAWVTMAATGSVEVCASLWAAEVLRGRAGMDAGSAAAAVSAIVAGMFVGRLVGGRLALRTGPVRLLLCALALSGAGFALFWLATVPWLAVLGLLVLGLGNAMHYPLGISLALRAAPGQEDRAAARASYGMALAFGVSPFVLGAVADAVGAHRAFLLVPVFLLVAAGLVTPLGRRLPAVPARAAA